MSDDGLEPPGCPLPGACSCPGGEAELATRLANAIRERDAALRQAEVMRQAWQDEAIKRDAAIAQLAAEPSQEDLTIVARSIGRTMKWENHQERAKDVFRSLRERDDTKPADKMPPIPDRLAAEREAGRRDGIEAAANYIENSASTAMILGGQFMTLSAGPPATAIRALRDTHAEGTL